MVSGIRSQTSNEPLRKNTLKRVCNAPRQKLKLDAKFPFKIIAFSHMPTTDGV
jgi:hypothetical protein